MDIQTLTSFFMWSSIISGSIFIFTALIVMLAPNFMYKIQSMFIDISQETFNIVIYAYLGLFKILFILFNLAPYLALLVIG